MTTAYSTNLELALPVQGELSGTWGDTVNNGITQYLDTAIAGSQIISGSQTAVTLSNTNGDASATNIAQAGSGATGTAQYQIIRCTGNPAGLLTITISDTGVAGYSKTFVIINATSTSQSVKIVGSGPTTGITVASGAKSFVAWNGSDFVEIASSTADGVTTFSAGTTGLTPNTATSGAITLAGTLATANGGTGLSGATPFTSGGVVYASSTSALATGSVLSFDGTNFGVGTNSPTARLQVNGTTDATQRIIVNGSGNVSSLKLQYNGTEVVQLQNYQSSEVQFGTTSSAFLAFVTNNTERARIDTAGYLSGVWADKVTALGNSGAAKTITCTAGNVFTATLTDNCTFTLASPSTTTASTATSFTLILTNDATAGRTVAWAGGTFKFPGGSVTRTTTANAVDIWFFFSPDGGTTWYGSIPMANLS
jgi:hypothetical protein